MAGQMVPRLTPEGKDLVQPVHGQPDRTRELVVEPAVERVVASLHGRLALACVSPTFMIDGLVQADMSSGDPIANWVSRLLKQ